MRARALDAPLLSVLLTLALAGCAAIPMTGPVQEGGAEVSEPDSVVVIAEGPEPDAAPDRIVDGFLLAAVAGLSADLKFEVARQFLSPDAAVEWNPLGGVTIVSGTKVERVGTTRVTVEASVVGKVDADGRYAEASQDARETVTFDMVQDSRQQWRIATAPAGLILNARQFGDQYRAEQLYFLSPDATLLVPETRYYPVVNLPTSVVKGLLGGPSPWLRDAVRTEIPRGALLAPESVPVDDAGKVEVDLGPVGAVLAADRPLMLAQIEATLRQLPQVHDVVVRAGANGTQLDGPAVLTTASTAEVTTGPEMIRLDPFRDVDQWVTLTSGRLAAVAEVGSIEGLGARSPALSEDGSLRVMLAGPDTLVLAPSPSPDATPGATTDPATDPATGDAADATTAPPPVALFTGPGLVAPSVDRLGWVWTATGSTIVAVDRGGTVVTLAPPWLVDRQVRAVRVSRDATRIAVISVGTDGVVAVDVSGIARDESDVPQQLSTEAALRVGASLTAADQVVWIDDTTLAVLARVTGSVRKVPVGARSEALPDVAGAVSLAGARLDRSLLVATQDGELLRFDGRTWAQVPRVTGVRDPAYPG